MNSLNEEEFSQKLKILEQHWNALEKAQPRFYDSFVRNKSTAIMHMMMRPVRKEAGLGSLPESFMTNATETVNSSLTSHTR